MAAGRCQLIYALFAISPRFAPVNGRTALVYFSNEWWRPGGQQFPRAQAEWISERQAVPFIRLMLRSSTEPAEKTPETVYTLDHILAGVFDKPLEAWGEQARRFGRPLVVEYGTECNGSWMPWNSVHNAPNGPRKFQATFRRIASLMSAATNITWVFHVNGDDNPKSTCNCLESYYPGDDIVDWLAVSCYGAQVPRPDGRPETFTAQMDPVYLRLKAMAPTKPVYVAEFGCAENNTDVTPPRWADAALKDLLTKANGTWDNLIGFSWWNSYWDNDPPLPPTNMLVQQIPGLPEVFQGRLNDLRVQVGPRQ